jgi:hypothetical protein
VHRIAVDNDFIHSGTYALTEQEQLLAIALPIPYWLSMNLLEIFEVGIGDSLRSDETSSQLGSVIMCVQEEVDRQCLTLVYWSYDVWVVTESLLRDPAGGYDAAGCICQCCWLILS